MDAVSLFLQEVSANFAEHITYAEMLHTFTPFLLYVVGIFLYSVLVFKFYRFLATKNILTFDKGVIDHKYLNKVKVSNNIALYILVNLILIPLIVLFWFVMLAVLLLLLGKNHSPESLILTSTAYVAAVRMCAYYNEDLARDLAKLVPFALLGLFLVDTSFLPIEYIVSLVQQIPYVLSQLAFYFIFVISVEFLLRVSRIVIRTIYHFREKKKMEESLLMDDEL